MIGKRVKEDRKCLATVIVEKIDEKKATLKLNATCKNISQFVLDKCFWKTEVGTMSAENLTSKIISCFIIEVREEFGLKDNEESMFMQLLQLGLNIMEDEGILKFKPDRMMYRKYVASKVSISYIRNPYSEEETEKIMEWDKAHPACVFSQAIALWYTKGLTLEDIVNLTKKDCWDSGRNRRCIKREGIELFQISIRAEIVRRALNTHPPKVEYVFSVPNSDKSGWKKLTERGLLMKLKYICKELDICYKPMLSNEAIKLNTN